MSLFGQNPLSTVVGQKIEQATSDQLPSEDWSLNLEICDLINANEENAKDAVKAIRRRLSHSQKNNKIILYTLTVLETCVKNTGHRFHVLVCNKDFVNELVKLIGPKNEPPAYIQDKVLSLIQAWAETFCNQPEMSGVCQVFADLMHKGITFPPLPADATPIITPNKSTAVRNTAAATGGASPRIASGGGAAPRHAPPPPPAPPAPPAPPVAITSSQSSSCNLAPEFRSKLERELGIVEGNAEVLAEMLSELTPGSEHPDDLQLLKELYATLEEMQRRLVDLVGQITDDHLTADLLRVNDLINNLFIRYNRHMAKSEAKGSCSPVSAVASLPTVASPAPDIATTVGGSVTSAAASNPPLAAAAAPPPLPAAAAGGSFEDVALIDLGDDAPSFTEQLARLDFGTKKTDEADFDSFAQSRTLPGDTVKKESDGPLSISSNGIPATNVMKSEQVETNFDCMERWLQSQPYSSEVSSDAFQKFLADRAAAAEKLPPIASPRQPDGGEDKG